MAPEPPLGDRGPDHDEAAALIDALLEGRLPPEGYRRLEGLVVSQPAIARLYVRLIHLSCSLPLHVARPEGRAAVLAMGDADPGVDRLVETMILPAVREADLPDRVDATTLRPPPPPPPALPLRRRRLPNPSRRWWLGLAAAGLLAVGLTWALWPRVPPAVLTATAAATLDGGSAAPPPGTSLAAGQTLHLSGGSVELTFASGAVVVVDAPAQVRVVDRGTLALDAGAVAAHVPPAARGFRVNSPGLSVVDLGTNFGVRTLDDGAAAEVHVFTGTVEAGGLDAAGRPTSAAVRVTADHAVRHDVADPAAAPVAVPFSPAGFDRDIAAVRLAVPLHGTGAGLAAGAADGQWQVTAVPDDRGWHRRPAIVVVNPRQEYAANTPAGRWVSTDGGFVDAPVGDFTFATSLDLSGFDPASALVVARVAADDVVVDVRVNGRSTGLSTPLTTPKESLAATHDLTVPGPWLSGPNQVEIIVENRPKPPGASPYNGMGLQLAWLATATPRVRR